MLDPAPDADRAPISESGPGAGGEGAAAPAQPPAKASRQRWWFWVLAVPAQVLLIILLALVWVLGTEAGLRTALALMDDLVPGLVQIEQVQGRLAGDLHLTGLEVRLPDLHLSAAEAHLRWRPWGALTGTLHIESLAARDLHIATAPSPPDPKPLTLPALVLPLGIEIGQATVEKLHISELREDPPPPFVIDRIAVAAGLNAGRLDLRELALDLPDLRFQARARGQGELVGDYPLGLDLDWTLTLSPDPHRTGATSEPPTVNGAGRISGDLSRLRLEYRITGAVALDLIVDVTGVLSAPAWDGRVDLHRIDLPAFDPGLPTVDLHGTLVTTGDRDQASVKGRLDGRATGAAAASIPGHLGADLDLVWAGRSLTIQTLRIEEDNSGAFLTATGTLALAARDGGHAGRAGATPGLAARDGGHIGNAGAVSDLEPAPGRVDIKADWEGLRWPLTGAAQVEARRGKVSVIGALDAYRYDLAAEVAGAEIPASALALTGEGSLKSSRIESLGLDTLGGRIDGSGEVVWDPALRWDLKLTARDLDPGLQVPDLTGRVGVTASSAGTLDGYGLQLQAKTGPVPEVAAKATAKSGSGAKPLNPAKGATVTLAASTALVLPEATLTLSAAGDVKSARVSSLRLDTLGGHVEGKGEGTWDPDLTWNVELTADGIDPGRQWSDWPGRLGGRLASRGAMTAFGADLSAQLDDLKGELRGYPVAAAAQVRMVGTEVTIDAFDASSGPSKASAKGRIGERLDLTFAVDSPDLATLLPDARGSLKADGSVLGTRAVPQIKLKLDAQRVAFADQGAASLTGQADVGLGVGGRFDIRLDGRDLAAGGLTWKTLELRGDGAMPDHRLSLVLKGQALSLDLKASGALKADNAYQGSLGQLDLDSAQYGRWRLQKPAPVLVAQPKVTVGPLCLREAKGGKGGAGSSGGCLGFAQAAAGKWDADIDLDRLAFDLLAPLLPKDLTAAGSASLKGRFVADGPVLTGTAALNIPRGSMTLKVGRKSQTFDFSNTRLGLESGTKALTAKFDLPLAGIGGVNLDLTLAGWRLDAPARPDQPLSARVQARVTDFRRVSALVPDLTGITGTLDLDMGLSGTLAKPGVKGSARLAGGGFDVPFLGLGVRNFALNADSVAADQVVYRGGLDLGKGRLDIGGDSTRGAAGWQTKVRVSGQRLKVADSRQFFALVSPDIALEVGAAGLAVSGEVVVPEARIRPRDIPPGTVSPSGDVVVGEPAAQAEPFPITADLRVVLGDQVSIDAFGLRGLLRGDLRVIKATGREPVGDGQISVVDGSYRLSGGLGVMAAIGKPLTVEQGILVFANTPLTNPGLLLTAQREGGNTSAGVRVVGTIKKPKLTFFSESDPDMSQSEITSYLITGVPPRRDNSDDARALSVGTYIGPKLYMEYESNLGDAADKVKLRYELNNRIELQTETGAGQGADIFYKFEN